MIDADVASLLQGATTADSVRHRLGLVSYEQLEMLGAAVDIQRYLMKVAEFESVCGFDEDEDELMYYELVEQEKAAIAAGLENGPDMPELGGYVERVNYLRAAGQLLHDKTEDELNYFALVEQEQQAIEAGLENAPTHVTEYNDWEAANYFSWDELNAMIVQECRKVRAYTALTLYVVLTMHSTH
jgi:hypothetical protein